MCTRHYITKSHSLIFLRNVFKVRFNLRVVRHQRLTSHSFTVLQIATITGKNHGNYMRIPCIPGFTLTKSWGKPHELDMSLMDPYILILQAFHPLKPIHPTAEHNTSSAFACNVCLVEQSHVLIPVNYLAKCLSFDIGISIIFQYLHVGKYG